MVTVSRIFRIVDSIRTRSSVWLKRTHMEVVGNVEVVLPRPMMALMVFACTQKGIEIQVDKT